MVTRKSIKLGTGLATGLLVLTLASTPAQAHQAHDVVGPVATFIALNWIFHHKHHRHHYYHGHGHYGYYHKKRHHKHYRKHSHSHGGYHKKHRVKHGRGHDGYHKKKRH